MIARTTLCSLLSVCLAFTALVLPTRAQATPVPALAMHARQLAPASVLDLDAEDEEAGAALTSALRKAFAARGMSGGDEMSFAEVKLTMGCENDDPKCLAGAGESLGISRMIYGYLRNAGNGYKVEVYVLDVRQGVIEAETAAPISASDLSDANIDDTAIEIVNSLFPDERDGELPTPVPVGDPDGETGDQPVVEDKPRRQSPYVWGKYKPRPKWKWAGFGTGVTLSVLGIIGTAVTASQLREGGPLNQELFAAADASLTDSNDANNIDRSVPGDLCDKANAAPPGDPGLVTNRNVAEVCQKADGYQLTNKITIAGMIVGLVTTAVFTTLLFVHKESPGAAAQRKRKPRKKRLLRFDAGPTKGGVLIGGSGRF